jgi:hypothetical protein
MLHAPLPAELRRSPPAARVGQLARESGLGFAHFEHRRWLACEAWEPERGDLGQVEDWRRGELPETKFRHFELDRRVGSFHPGHQARWGAHELCHGLVGHAWAPGRSLFWHSQAARLAELLPVALWYYFDQSGLQRCGEHEGQPAPGGAPCPACEERAEGGPGPEDPAILAAGRAFVEGELAAIRRSLREGRPLGHRVGQIDLKSDGLAYVAAHGPRLLSPQMALLAERFGGAQQGWHPDLESLSERVRELCAWICGGPPARPLDGDPERWVALDLASRLLRVHAEAEGPCAEGLLSLVDELSGGRPGAVEQCIRGYQALGEDWVLPPAEEVFAVGYPLPMGLGSDVAQLQMGVATAAPMSWARLGAGRAELVRAFAAQDGLQRSPLVWRWARFLLKEHPGLAAELAEVEAALLTAPPPDEAVLSLERPQPGEACRLAPGVRLIHSHSGVEALLADRRPPPRSAPRYFALQRGLDGESSLLRLSERAWRALSALEQDPQALTALPAEEAAQLVEAELVAPLRWTLEGPRSDTMME